MSFTYKFKTKPYRHQVAALKKLLSTKYGGALLMAPRTGKTKTAIDYASILHIGGAVNRVLVMCPPSVMGVWEDEIAAHCPVPYRITIWDKKGRKRQELPRWGRDILDFVIINHEAFSVPGAMIGRNEDGEIKRSRSRGGRFDMKKKLRQWQPQLTILDESHRIKSPSARKTTTIRSIVWKRLADGTYEALVPYRILLTGTVVTKRKRAYDVYAQWKYYLNPNAELVKGMTFADFKDEYGVFINVGKYDLWKRNKNIERFKTLLHEDAFAVERDECFDLPKHPHIPIHFDLYESAKIYDDMAEEMVAELKTKKKDEGIAEASIPLVAAMKLSQITSGWTKNTEGKVVQVGSEKLEVAQNLLEDWFDNDEKIVVAARWRWDIVQLAAFGRKQKVPVFELHGGITRVDRDVSIKQFRALKNQPAIFIMQPSAGSLGIDLRTATMFLWYSLTNSFVDYTQGNDRVGLAEHHVPFNYLLARNTVDQVLYDSLQEDGQVVQAIQRSPDRLLRSFKR